MVAKKKAKPNGRPPAYTDKIADTICKKLEEGESLNAICKTLPKVCRATVYNWLSDEKHTEFLDKYTQARERQAETFIDQCVDIADDKSNDTILVEGKDGNEYERVNHDHINRSRLRVDTRIKIAEKMAPRKYSAKHDVSLSGDITIKIIDSFK